MELLTSLTDAEWHKARDELLVRGRHDEHGAAGA
jgi:hypothetical protein